MTSNSHKCKLIEATIERGKTTAAQFNISNANQYFVQLEEVGIIKSVEGLCGDSRVKWRYIADMDKALNFISVYGKKTKANISA
jgi:hypothetical protein